MSILPDIMNSTIENIKVENVNDDDFMYLSTINANQDDDEDNCVTHIVASSSFKNNSTLAKVRKLIIYFIRPIF